MKKRTKTFILFTLMMITSSCGDQPLKFLTNGPFYLKGLKEAKRGDHVKAEASFLKDLEQKKSYASHLQLMFIYEDQKKYPEVIVQCDKYLTTARSGDFNLNLVKEIKKNALVSLHMQLNSQFGRTTTQKTINKEKVDDFFRQKWYASRVRERDLEHKVAQLENNVSLRKLIDKAEATTKSQKTTSKEKSKSSLKQIRTYRVVKGDSLSVISSKVFGTSKRWREIQSANLPALDNPNKLRLGQIINIPQPVKPHKKAPISKSVKKQMTPKSKTAPALDKKKTLNPVLTNKKNQTSKPLGLQKNPMPRGRD